MAVIINVSLLPAFNTQPPISEDEPHIKAKCKGRVILLLKKKNRLAQFLIANNTNGKVHKGKVKEAAAQWGVCRRSVQYTWKKARLQVLQGKPINLVNGQLGVPKVKHVLLDKDRFKGIPWEKRTTIRRLANALEVSKSQLHRWIKVGDVKAHTNQIKPELNSMNKLQRLQYALNALVPTLIEGKFRFQQMQNTIHINEKWFFMTRACERGYKLDEELDVHRSCKSKKFITKIMFLCAVARPIWAEDGELLFDGKLGIFPFTYNEAAKRNSKNRPKGTLLTKPIESINKDVTKEQLIEKIIPSIKAKWPNFLSKDIFIQQDNAKPHIKDSDEDFREAASSDGFNIRLVCQPPNSPDTNINDLGWFRAIQSLQVDTSSYNVEALIANVLRSYDELEPVSLNNVFLSLQASLIEVMRVKGGNNYKLPHMGKERLIREGLLPMNCEVDEVLVRETIDHLNEAGVVKGVTYDITEIKASLGYV